MMLREARKVSFAEKDVSTPGGPRKWLEHGRSSDSERAGSLDELFSAVVSLPEIPWAEFRLQRQSHRFGRGKASRRLNAV